MTPVLARGANIGKVILGAILALAVAAGLIVLVAPLIIAEATGGSNYQIRDDAMAPALLQGDWVLAEALPPGSLPPRGAIIAFEVPHASGQYEVRRLIGLPGERVQMRGGAVYIDGKRAGMTRMEDRIIARRPSARRARMPHCINDPVEIDGECRQERWRETLPDGTETVVLNAKGKIGTVRFGQRGTTDDTKSYRVPPDAVFVIGDNRDDSIDSRAEYYGMVPVRNIQHRVWMIHSSLDKSGRFIYPRFDRFFRRID